MSHREFWEAGFKIFGLYGRGPDGKCECGSPNCPDKSLYKHPRVSNWQHTPHWSDDQFETMEDMGQFKTGYGILLKDQYLVVDIDARNGGLQSWVKLSEDIPEVSGSGLIVDTGSGGGSRHLYFKVPEGTSLMIKLPEYPGIDFKSGAAYVVGPGSLHASGKTYSIAYGGPEEIDDIPERLLAKLTVPERHRADIGGQTVDVSHQDLAEMVASIAAHDDYETWVRVGMALHHASGGSAFDVWDLWSQKSSKYSSEEMPKKWHSFGRSANPVTLGTLVHYAEQGGWKQPVTFTPSVEFDFEDVNLGSKTVDITGVDLLRPPGLAGVVAQWVEGNNRRQRERLSVMAAIYALGNIFGLRYIDDMDRVTTNLFVFNVAGSGTGKEAIQDSVKAIHMACGLSGATHGSIKSEQEIVRNIIRHQPSLYLLDEVAFFLQKIKNAQSKGGAPYLDGVIGLLMSAYSKADGFFLVNGDMKDDVRAMLKRELMQIEKTIESDGEKPFLTSKKAGLEYQLLNIDKGFSRPFVSMSGFTTNVNFEKLVDFEAATNGFIARALLCVEHETVPRKKKKWKKSPLPESIANTLQQLSMAGSFDTMASDARIEYNGDKVIIPTSSDAVEMLSIISDLFDDMGERHKSSTGLEALALRGYEQVAKVSLILAVPEGIRTKEHVRWAYALVKRDIETKMLLVTANNEGKNDNGRSFKAKIASMISGEDGETLGVLQNRLRSHKPDEVETALNKLVSDGVVEVLESVHKFTKKSIKRYKLKKVD